MDDPLRPRDIFNHIRVRVHTGRREKFPDELAPTGQGFDSAAT